MTLSLICYQHLIIVVIAVANQHNGVSYEAIALLLINLNASFFLSWMTGVAGILCRFFWQNESKIGRKWDRGTRKTTVFIWNSKNGDIGSFFFLLWNWKWLHCLVSTLLLILGCVKMKKWIGEYGENGEKQLKMANYWNVFIDFAQLTILDNYLFKHCSFWDSTRIQVVRATIMFLFIIHSDWNVKSFSF